jgi:formiminoglutamase
MSDFQWQGRIDGQDREHLRFHQLITPFKSAQPPGVALLGFASDEGVKRNHGRIGAAKAPDVIRQQLANMAIHQTFNIYDAGNISCEGNLELAQQQLADFIKVLLEEGHFPITLGGGHEVAYGSFMGLFQHVQSQPSIPRIGIINFDAHFDLRENIQATSGTPFLQIAQQLQQHQQDFNYLCLGISENSNTSALFERAKSLNVDYILDNKLNLMRILEHKLHIERFLEQVDMVYLTIDLDVFSYTQAPGVSAPAVLGVELAVVRQLLQYIFLSKKVRLVDIAECNPDCDIHNHTARLAAYLVMEMIKNHVRF